MAIILCNDMHSWHHCTEFLNHSIALSSEKIPCFFYFQSHNDALDDHRRITMDEYKKEYRKVEIRHCETHKDKVYNVACEKCHEVFCVKCMLRPTSCSDGKAFIHISYPFTVLPEFHVV